MDAPVPAPRPPRPPMGPLLSFLVFGPLALLVIGGALWGLILYQQRAARQRFELTLCWADGAPQIRTRLDPAWRPAPAGVSPHVGDEVKTEAGPRTVLAFDRRTTIRMSRNTAVRVEEVARVERLEIRLRLLSGRIWVDASPTEHVTVLPDAGEVTVEGRAAEIVVDVKSTELLAWQGRLAYAPVAGDPPRWVEQGQALLLPMGGPPRIHKVPAQQDVWQAWNAHADTRELAAGSLPALPGPARAVEAPLPAAIAPPIGPRPKQTVDIVPRPVRARAGVYRSHG